MQPEHWLTSSPGHCHTCTQCLQGQFNVCQTMEINGVTRDGGFAEYCLLRTNCVVRVPRCRARPGLRGRHDRAPVRLGLRVNPERRF